MSARSVLNNLDDHGVVRVGTFVVPGRYPGRRVPAEVTEADPDVGRKATGTAIFGQSAEDVEERICLKCRPASRASFIDTPRFSQLPGEHDGGRACKAVEAKEQKDIENCHAKKIADQFRVSDELRTRSPAVSGNRAGAEARRQGVRAPVYRQR